MEAGRLAIPKEKVSDHQDMQGCSPRTPPFALRPGQQRLLSARSAHVQKQLLLFGFDPEQSKEFNVLGLITIFQLI